MNTRMDGEPTDDSTDATEEPSTADAPADAGSSDDDNDATHLDSLPDGAGCAEVWEYLSESRDDE